MLLASLAAPASAADPKSEDEKTVYAMGAMVAQRLKNLALSPAEVELVVAGVQDQLMDRELKVDLDAQVPKFQAFAQGRQAVAVEAEKKRAGEYLAKAATEPGVRKLDSGLLYKELRAGTGVSPQATDKVKVHYTGTLTDGTKFDSSVDRGDPASFPLNGVIACWTEGLQLMKVGGKARLTCPADIAYGDQGRPPKIPGGATLLFDVELIEIQ
jgi:FKBP-type peptidyl-prolyl cis-trans isomerase FkpA